jgi:hypothetical protein
VIFDGGETMVPGWESNPSGGLILRNLLILRKSKTEKNRKNAEVRYTAGTRYRPTFAPAFFGPTIEAQPIWLDTILIS